jgi:hypothetical protein
LPVETSPSAESTVPITAGAGTIADVSASFVPATVTFVPGESSEVRLIVSNPTDRRLHLEAPQVASTPGLTLSDLTNFVSDIPAARTYTARLTAAADRYFEEGTINLVIPVRLPRLAGPPSAGTTAGSLDDVRVLTPSLAVNASAQTPALTLAVLDSPSNLTDDGHDNLTLAITNSSPFEVSDVAVVPLASRDISVETTTTAPAKKDHPHKSSATGTVAAPIATTPPAGSAGTGNTAAAACPAEALQCVATIGPGDTVVVTVQLRAAKTVHAGKQTVGVLVRGTVLAGSPPTAAPDSSGSAVAPAPRTPVVSYVLTKTATKEVDVSVFGIDAISPLGITSLILIPGAAAALTFGLLRRVYPKRSDKAADLKDPSLLLIIIIIGAGVYAVIWAVRGRDLAHNGAGTLDVIVMAMFGLGLGVAAYGAYAAAYYYFIDRKDFKTRDQPAKVLARLATREGTLLRQRFGESSYSLGTNADGKLALSPAITYLFLGDDDEYRRRFESAVTSGSLEDVKKLADQSDRVSLAWQGGGGVELTDKAPAGAVAMKPLLLPSEADLTSERR